MSNSRQIRVLRDGQENGTYTVNGAMMLLQAGHLKNTDLYWEEGMTGWAPLSQLRDSELPGQVAGKFNSGIICRGMDVYGSRTPIPKAEADHGRGCLVLIIPLLVCGLALAIF